MKPLPIPFPNNAKIFNFRGDAAIELGFLEFATSRAVMEQIKTAVYTGNEPGEPIVDKYDADLRGLYRPARWYAYCSVGMKSLGVIAAHVTDGSIWMPVVPVGLYKEMLERAAMAYGAPGRVLVAPARPAKPFTEWLYPPNAVLHDTLYGSAAIVPYHTAISYLTNFNP